MDLVRLKDVDNHGRKMKDIVSSKVEIKVLPCFESRYAQPFKIESHNQVGAHFVRLLLVRKILMLIAVKSIELRS